MIHIIIISNLFEISIPNVCMVIITIVYVIIIIIKICMKLKIKKYVNIYISKKANISKYSFEVIYLYFFMINQSGI